MSHISIFALPGTKPNRDLDDMLDKLPRWVATRTYMTSRDELPDVLAAVEQAAQEGSDYVCFIDAEHRIPHVLGELLTAAQSGDFVAASPVTAWQQTDGSSVDFRGPFPLQGRLDTLYWPRCTLLRTVEASAVATMLRAQSKDWLTYVYPLFTLHTLVSMIGDTVYVDTVGCITSTDPVATNPLDNTVWRRSMTRQLIASVAKEVL